MRRGHPQGVHSGVVTRTQGGPRQLRTRLEAALTARLSPERTRRATLVERLTMLAARSMLGFVRWRLQRELWRRDVERLTSAQERDQT